MLLIKKFVRLFALPVLLLISSKVLSQDSTGVSFSFAANRNNDSEVVI
jgi:hypothetical protein